MTQPLAVDLFCGLGGWTKGLLAEGWNVVGFDLERHEYSVPNVVRDNEGGNKGTRPMKGRGWSQGCAVSLGMEGPDKLPATRVLRYPAQLVLQDVRTLDGAQFRGVDLIVASPPCQTYSWMAMPWKRAKAKAAWYREDPDRIVELNELFDACFRIQREASAAAGRRIPMVVENVCGAQPWVGRARWHYGSYYLWGDVPALMPITARRPKIKGGDVGWRERSGMQLQDHFGVKVGGLDWSSEDKAKRGCFRDSALKNGGRAFPNEHADRGVKNGGGSWFNIAHNTTSGKGQNPVGRKQPGISGTRRNGKGDAWFQDGAARHGSKSSKRKAASAMIAEIPLELARWIGHVYHPEARRAL